MFITFIELSFWHVHIPYAHDIRNRTVRIMLRTVRIILPSALAQVLGEQAFLDHIEQLQISKFDEFFCQLKMGENRA